MTRHSALSWTVSFGIVGALASAAFLACGSSSNGGFGDSGSPSGSSASSSGSSSSGAQSSSSGSSSSSSSGTGSSGSSSGAYVVDNCGKPCDLRSNTCCLPADGGADAAFCLATNTVSCGSDVATFHCLGASDCTGGNVCCGTYDLTSLTAETVCQAPTCAVAQFCKTSAECKNNMDCIAQSCTGGANVHLCGLQSGPPYNCVAN